MDAPTSIENIPFVWGIAFSINLLMAVTCFAMIIRREAPSWAGGVCCWIAWWSCATAFSLVINTSIGVANPFAYHQMGVFTESMTNLGIAVWCFMFLMKNWNVHGDGDLERIEETRRQITIDNLKKESDNATQ